MKSRSVDWARKGRVQAAAAARRRASITVGTAGGRSGQPSLIGRGKPSAELTGVAEAEALAMTADDHHDEAGAAEESGAAAGGAIKLKDVVRDTVLPMVQWSLYLAEQSAARLELERQVGEAEQAARHQRRTRLDTHIRIADLWGRDQSCFEVIAMRVKLQWILRSWRQAVEQERIAAQRRLFMYQKKQATRVAFARRGVGKMRRKVERHKDLRRRALVSLELIAEVRINQIDWAAIGQPEA
jgi:hypothetical protein